MKTDDSRLFTYTIGPTGPAVLIESQLEILTLSTVTSSEAAEKNPSQPLHFRDSEPASPLPSK